MVATVAFTDMTVFKMRFKSNQGDAVSFIDDDVAAEPSDWSSFIVLRTSTMDGLRHFQNGYDCDADADDDRAHIVIDLGGYHRLHEFTSRCM